MAQPLLHKLIEALSCNLMHQVDPSVIGYKPREHIVYWPQELVEYWPEQLIKHFAQSLHDLPLQAAPNSTKERQRKGFYYCPSTSSRAV